MAVWCLSVQCVPAAELRPSLPALTSALGGVLASPRYESKCARQYALLGLARALEACPAEVAAQQGGWVRPVLAMALWAPGGAQGGLLRRHAAACLHALLGALRTTAAAAAAGVSATVVDGLVRDGLLARMEDALKGCSGEQLLADAPGGWVESTKGTWRGPQGRSIGREMARATTPGCGCESREGACRAGCNIAALSALSTLAWLCGMAQGGVAAEPEPGSVKLAADCACAWALFAELLGPGFLRASLEPGRAGHAQGDGRLGQAMLKVRRRGMDTDTERPLPPPQNTHPPTHPLYGCHHGDRAVRIRTRLACDRSDVDEAMAEP